jgi:hypothetical protein
LKEGMVVVSSETKGATISYQVIRKDVEQNTWELYQRPVEMFKDSCYKVIAHRLGYQESNVVSFQCDQNSKE